MEELLHQFLGIAFLCSLWVVQIPSSENLPLAFSGSPHRPCSKRGDACSAAEAPRRGHSWQGLPRFRILNFGPDEIDLCYCQVSKVLVPRLATSFLHLFA